MWGQIRRFSSSVGEREIMNHFVVKSIFSTLVAALPPWDLRGAIPKSLH
jgi:hypothetical protein